MTNGTINGGVYASRGSWSGGSSSPETYSYYTIPNGTIIWARLYVGVWGGTSTSTGIFNTSVNGNYYDLVTIDGEEDSNPTYSTHIFSDLLRHRVSSSTILLLALGRRQ